jgi:predicted O-methyltransferase YrrM
MNPGAVLLNELNYRQAFELERDQQYACIDAFEGRLGFSVSRDRLEEAARVLACPVKRSRPNWQHGRVLYALTRAYIERLRVKRYEGGWLTALDIGTAKGFSALCMHWAIDDSGYPGQVISLDVIDPDARIARNTIAEVSGLKTLAEILEPWPEAGYIAFEQRAGRDWLAANPNIRPHIAYVDGKHSYTEVSVEAALIASRQQFGDLVVFDDIQIPGVAQAVSELRGYDVEHLWPLLTRGYAIARKR